MEFDGDRIVALHEAAHAVVSEKLGVFVDGVGARAATPDPDETLSPEDLIMIDMAGSLADERDLASRRQRHLDRIRHYATVVDMPVDGLDALIQELSSRTESMLDECWGDIEAVAERLIADGDISGEEVRRILRHET